MVALFGPSEPDLERLRTTVESLGTTSVPGLAAALSWRERKAERVLAHELARPGSPLVYDPGRRVVRWARPLPDLPPPPPPTGAASTPATGFLPKASVAPRATFAAGGFKSVCPACHVPLQAAGTGNLAVCPSCGRLATAHAIAAERPAVPAPPAPSPSAPGAGAPPSPISLADRRAQELFAAYVTSRPIPCPKCRTPLRHRALSEYACPSCGQTVRFPAAGPPPPPPPVPPPPA